MPPGWRIASDKRASNDRPICWGEADFPGLIRAMPNWVTSESPTTQDLAVRRGIGLNSH
jgi:hypothetical protein